MNEGSLIILWAGAGHQASRQTIQTRREEMNKMELIDRIAASADLSKASAAKCLDGALAAITKALKAGDKVTLVGFGTFSTASRAARTGRNPQTGKSIKIKAKKVARFKVGSKLAAVIK
jgi:DNA-binding protein HU-beta